MFSCSGYSGFLPQFKHMQVGLIGQSNLACRCECEREQLFIPICQPCDALNFKNTEEKGKRGKRTRFSLRAEFIRKLN